MTHTKFVSKLLNLKGVKIKTLFFRKRNSELVICVKPHKNGCLCPNCNRRCKIVKQMKCREWKDIPVSGTQVFFNYSPKEIYCPTHGRIQENIPWASWSSRVTSRLEYLILVYSQNMTQGAASQMLNLASSTFSNLLHRIITRERQGHKIRTLNVIGVDEISYSKGKKFCTIVYNLETSKVLWVGKGKGRETIDKFFTEELSEYQRNNIKKASCDLGEAYIGSIEKYCPNAILVLDKFHVVKLLHKAMDEVRLEEWRKVAKGEKKFFKGVRWLMFKHSNNRSKAETKNLNQLSQCNRRIHRAWVLKDEFANFWDYSYQKSANDFLNGWLKSAMRSRLEPLKRFVRTIRKHITKIQSYITTPITNATAEGLNRIMKIVKNRASGFHNLDAFSDLIFLCVGDVDIPAQIPKRFQTITMRDKYRRRKT